MDQLKGKNLLFIDLETSGLPSIKARFAENKTHYYGIDYNQAYDTSRLLSLSYIYIPNVNEESKYVVNSFLVQPPKEEKEFNISEEALALHGITYDKIKGGEKMITILNKNKLGTYLSKCDMVVGHNVLFDLHILGNDFYRRGLSKAVKKVENILKEDKYFCTLKYGTPLCNIKIKGTNFLKAPKLKELYSCVMKKNMEEEHQSHSDVKAVCDIVLKLMA